MSSSPEPSETFTISSLTNFESFNSVNTIIRINGFSYYCWIINTNTYRIMDGNTMIFENTSLIALNSFLQGLVHGKNYCSFKSTTTP